jgi:MtaA/CmuA family methyltransferase
MTPKERLLHRLDGEAVDKVPNLNIVMLFASKHAGIPYGEFCKDYRRLVEAQLKTAKDFGIDIVSTMSDAYREASDFGADIRFQEDDLPVCEKAFLRTTDDFGKLKLWDPEQSVRTLDRINAVKFFKDTCGEEYAILGWIEGAWAEFTDLTTLSEGMMMLFDEPEEVQKAMELIANQEIRCALAQLEAGADIIGMGDAAASLVSPDTYKEYVFPFEKMIIDAIHEAGGKTKLHICGNINHLLPIMIETGSDIIDIDYMVDYGKAVELAAGRCSICGNLNPVDIILQGNVDDVRQKVLSCLSVSDKRSIISSGCEVPKMSPEKNVLVVDEQLREVMN